MVREGVLEVTLELQEVSIERSGDRAFQIGEQGTVQGEGCGWTWGCFGGTAVRLTERLCGEERIFSDPEVLASAPRRTVTAFTEYSLNYVLLCIAEHGSYE